MSVYTAVNQHQLKDFLSHYSLGNLLSFSGIQAGIENSNYAVVTSHGKFILTLFETLSAEDISPYFSLLNHLGYQGFPSPSPQARKDHLLLSSLNNKPAALFNFLPGNSVDMPSIEQCQEMGKYLAKLHLYAKDSGFIQSNPKDLNGCLSIFNKMTHALSPQDNKLLRSELDYQLDISLPPLPQGVIHADLFKDNVLIQDNYISAILDFYNACNDYFIFDIAVTCNDWCAEGEGINQLKLTALLFGYQSIRPLSIDEIDYLAVFLRRAALRFWVSRLEHQLNPKQGELTLVKDPLTFKYLLEFHRASAEAAA